MSLIDQIRDAPFCNNSLQPTGGANFVRWLTNPHLRYPRASNSNSLIARPLALSRFSYVEMVRMILVNAIGSFYLMVGQLSKGGPWWRHVQGGSGDNFASRTPHYIGVPLAKVPDHPQLPFEGGLPEAPETNRKKQYRNSAPLLPPSPRRCRSLRRFGGRARRWAVRVVGDSLHEIVVHIIKLLILSCIGLGVADEGFDVFGRHSPKTSEKATVTVAKVQTIGEWTLEVREGLH